MTGSNDCRALLEEVSRFLVEHYRGEGVDELRGRVDRALAADAAPRFGATHESSQINLRTLLKAVASGAVSPEDAARLIESWPAPGGVS